MPGDGGGVAAIRQLLSEAVEQIARLPAGQPEAGVGAFNAFRRGVTQASSGREVPPDQLLADLEPKGAVWRFLVGLVQRKPMYRKQVAALAFVLLSCRPWLDALRAEPELREGLPEELAGALGEAEAKLSEPEGEVSEEEEGRRDLAVGSQISRRQSCTQRALDMLARGLEEIEALRYCAVPTDDAIGAFNTFQRAVMWVVASPQQEDDEALEGLKHKDRVLSFIIDFYTRKPTHRLRIASIFVRLLGFDNWRAAILADPPVRAVAWETTKDPELAPGSPEELQPEAVSIDAAVQEAAANGSIGAVYVRVIAAHDLVGGVCPVEELSLHVNVAVGDALKRTEAIAGCLSPRWASSPLLLEVPSWETPLRFEVLDSDFDKDESFGSLEIPIRKLPTEPGSSFSRHALDGVVRGELELELIFGRASEGAEDAAPMSWLVSDGRGPALARKWSMTTNGRIVCPAGHEVDECKERKRTTGWGLFGGKKEKKCNICNLAIPAAAERWRCSFHCDFNVCSKCHGSGGG